uniref:ribosomal protein S11 n=1 Tax=Antithamnionella miharai TaxID=536589 RepID=UPI002E771441|nr:ribosomal protein S11 [Antithamnionella miharai]WQF69351.1 ribosomal protein S11 [Antithamnionella miharai]WQF69376.1 ribosomal protein S11 [Antithamnionella miharai]
MNSIKKNSILHILFTSNNIFFTNTNSGKVFFSKSIGVFRSKGVKKINLTSLKSLLNVISRFISKEKIFCKIKGYSKYKRLVLKLLLSNPKIRIQGFYDLTNLPHNGCKRSKLRRI